MKEYPRGGAMNGDIINRTEMHLPCVVLVDTSSSMRSVQDQIERGLDNSSVGGRFFRCHRPTDEWSLS